MPTKSHRRSIPINGKLDPTYSCWNNMRRRCMNPKHPNYMNYGGRGISICSRWSSFANFLADMGDKPAGKSLERIDNNAGYSPENCKWATPTEQAKNTRNTIVVKYRGIQKPLCEWAVDCGVSLNTLYYRIRRGWTVEDAIKTPIVPHHPRKPKPFRPVLTCQVCGYTWKKRAHGPLPQRCANGCGSSRWNKPPKAQA